MRSALCGILAAGLTLSVNYAIAGSTTTINGVTIPTDFSASGSNQLDAGIVGANIITAPGETLTAVGMVTAVTDSSNNIIWSNGQNGTSLAFTVTNFLAQTVTAPTSTNAGSITFNGGTVDFYTVPTTFTMGGHGSPGADVAAIVAAGTLWLSQIGTPEDAAGDTLIASIPINSTLTNFVNGTVAGYGDVTGGAAATNFATHTFANAFATPSGFSDTELSANFNTGATGDFQLSGTAFMKADTTDIPEPGGMALVLLGVLGLLWLRRDSFGFDFA